ncbi:MAG: histidinol-phosphate transaminase [Gammaproteobacteria bacterium]
MPCSIKKLVNPDILAIELYQPGKPIQEVQQELGLKDIIKLASNENPLGPSPLVTQAIQKHLQDIHYYPDAGAHDLKKALANHLNVSPNSIIVGNGSENVLAMISHTFIKPNDEIIISKHAFATFTIIAHESHGKPVYIPENNWRHDLKATLKACNQHTKLIYIANPGNPIGTYNTDEELRELLTSVPEHTIVVLDEAYYEYVNEKDYPNTLKLMESFPNLIVTRTFSKLYGLAGLRIGYGIARPEIIELLNRVRLPFNVSSIAQIAAIKALEDQDYVEASLTINREGMKQMQDELKNFGLKYIPSVTNFMTIKVPENGLSLYKKLLNAGIIVRPLVSYQLPDYIRVTIGTQTQNERFLKALAHLI